VPRTRSDAHGRTAREGVAGRSQMGAVSKGTLPLAAAARSYSPLRKFALLRTIPGREMSRLEGCGDRSPEDGSSAVVDCSEAG
jgi:hypothetical protein